jgi:exodeoxyribonuclease III
MDDDLLDPEGRVLLTEFESFTLVNAYAPHSHRKLLRLDAKLHFCEQFLSYTRRIRLRGKPIIVVGDLNVAHQEIDLSNPVENKKNAGFLPEERRWMTALLEEGLIDAFRMFCADSGHFTWWSVRKGVRERNVGWRLDYVLVDSGLANRVKSCFHSPRQLGSDHCPVTVDIEL